MNNWWIVFIILQAVCLLLIPLSYIVIKNLYGFEYYTCKFAMWDGIAGALFSIAWTILGLASIIILCFTIFSPIKCKREAMEYEEIYNCTYEVIANEAEAHNLGVTEYIMTKNEWLAKARAKSKLYGNWSFYTTSIDLDSLDYIVIESTKSEPSQGLIELVMKED